jgi:septum formation protein
VPLAAPLILASTSTYRRTLLERLGLRFEAVGPGVDEAHRPTEAAQERALRLATAKADAISSRHPQAVVIGSDQVAVCGESMLDKPGEAERARAQLAHLSGATAQFLTACCVRCRSTGFLATHVDVTSVRFRTLASEEIERYVALEQPLDCAGSFKAEGLGITLLESIDSRDPTGLIGLPLIWLAKTLRRAGYLLP